MHFHLHQLFTADQFSSRKYLQLLTTKGDDGDCLILTLLSLFCLFLFGLKCPYSVSLCQVELNSIDTFKVFLCRLWASRNDIGLFEDHQIGSQPSTNWSVIVSTMSFNVIALCLPFNFGDKRFCRRNQGCTMSGILREVCSSAPEAQRTFVALHLALHFRCCKNCVPVLLKLKEHL